MRRAPPPLSEPDARSVTLCAGPWWWVLFTGRLRPLPLRRRGAASFLWSSRAPSRVKFFGWLLTQSRVHTRDVLLRKTVLTAAEAGCPCCEAELETADHLIFRCPFAVQFWRRIGLPPAAGSVRALHRFDASPAVGANSPACFVLLCCWRLWKHRNAIVFQGDTMSLAATLKACRDDAVLWRGRMKTDDQSQAYHVVVHA